MCVCVCDCLPVLITWYYDFWVKIVCWCVEIRRRQRKSSNYNFEKISFWVRAWKWMRVLTRCLLVDQCASVCAAAGVSEHSKFASELFTCAVRDAHKQKRCALHTGQWLLLVSSTRAICSVAHEQHARLQPTGAIFTSLNLWANHWGWMASSWLHFSVFFLRDTQTCQVHAEIFPQSSQYYFVVNTLIRHPPLKRQTIRHLIGVWAKQSNKQYYNHHYYWPHKDGNNYKCKHTHTHKHQE